MLSIDQQRTTQRERLFFIEFCLLFLGGLRRKDLVTQFQISEPAATKDLALYADLNPEALTYDFRQKRYHYTGGQLQFEHNVDQSLFAIAGNRAITQTFDHTMLVPSFVGSSIKRQVPIEIAATITRCMHLQHKMVAAYRSMSGGERVRHLTPLALIHDGLRWHIRCLDKEDAIFKDYNLARFAAVEALDVSTAELHHDTAWNQWIELELIPHPNSEHPETILLDYDMDDLGKTINLRSCVVGYFLRYWPIDYSDGATDDPREHQLFLANKQELIDAGVTEWAFR